MKQKENINNLPVKYICKLINKNPKLWEQLNKEIKDLETIQLSLVRSESSKLKMLLRLRDYNQHLSVQIVLSNKNYPLTIFPVGKVKKDVQIKYAKKHKLTDTILSKYITNKVAKDIHFILWEF